MSWRDSAVPVQPQSWRDSAIPVNPPAKLEDADLNSPTKVAKGMEGAALGVADVVNSVFNPVNIAHGVHTISTMMDPELAQIPKDPNLGFFGRIKASYQAAEKSNPIPTLNVDDITAGARTGIDLAQKITQGQIPSKEDVKNTYASEQKANEEFNKEVGPSVGRKIGSGAAQLAMASLMAKDIANMGGMLDSKLGTLAEGQAYKATQPMGRLNTSVTNQGRELAIGRQLLDDKIIGPAASPSTMLDRVQSKLDDYGSQIGHFAKAADEAVSRDSSIRSISVDDFINQVNTKIKPELIEKGASTSVKQLDSWIQDNLVPAAKDGEISFSQAQNIKTTLGQEKAKFATANDSNTVNAYRDAYRLLNNNIENGIGSALSSAGSSENLSQFQKAKDSYRNLLDAESFLENAVARGNKNMSFGLTSRQGGIMGELLGNTPVQKIMGGAVGAIGSKLATSKGNQAAASLLDSIQKLNGSEFLTTPLQKIPFTGGK